MTSEAMQIYAFAALLRVLGRIDDPDRDGAPTVVLLDDVHLAGPTTVEWLQFALRRRDESPLLVVASRRPEEGPIIHGTRRITLDPLDLETVRHLVGPGRAGELYQRSGGNPLLLVELAGAEGDGLPTSVRESVAERLDRAGPDAAAAIRATANLGPDVDLELLAAVLDRPPVLILDDLEERGDHFVFRHALVREALVAGTSVTRQAFVHRQAARARDGRVGADALVLARHARLGGERSLAARALMVAADQATARYDLDEAERHLDDAIDLDPTTVAHLARGRVRVARSDLNGADADGQAVMRLGLRPEGLALRAWVARNRHDLDAAIRLGTEGASTATDPDTRASCLLVVAMADRGLGRLPTADDRLAEAMAIETRTDLGLRGWLGVLRVHQGRAAEAIDLLDPALGAEIDVVHGFWVEHVLQMAAHAHGINGEPTRALALVDRLTVEMVRRGSDVRYRGLDDNYRAWILGNLGDPAAADHNLRAVEQGRMPEIVVQATLDLAATSYHRGEFDHATARVAAATDQAGLVAFTNRWRCDQRAQWLLALLAQADDRSDDALAHGQRLALDAEARGDAGYRALAQLAQVRARHSLGEPVDLDQVAVSLAALPRVTGLEAWWLTAETAATFGVDRWWDLADQRVVELAAHAGGRRDQFVAYAQQRFARLGRR